jgi:hypothetical protein
MLATGPLGPYAYCLLSTRGGGGGGGGGEKKDPFLAGKEGQGAGKEGQGTDDRGLRGFLCIQGEASGRAGSESGGGGAGGGGSVTRRFRLCDFCACPDDVERDGGRCVLEIYLGLLYTCILYIARDGGRCVLEV